MPIVYNLYSVTKLNPGALVACEWCMESSWKHTLFNQTYLDNCYLLVVQLDYIPQMTSAPVCMPSLIVCFYTRDRQPCVIANTIRIN